MAVKVYSPERKEEKDDLEQLAKIASIGVSIAGMGSGKKADAVPKAPVEATKAVEPDYLGTKDSTNLNKAFGNSAMDRRLETLTYQSPNYLGTGKLRF